MRRVLIIGAGRAIEDKLLKRLEKWANVIICADGGGDIAKNAGVKPTAVIGDFDSISKEAYAYYNKSQEVTLINIREQETTDMEKAVIFALSSGAVTDIVLTCASGSRADHFLHTLGLLFKYRNRTNIRIVDGENIISLKTASFRESCIINERISLIPYGGAVKNVGTMGLKYPLQGQELIPGVKESISNQASRESISVNFDGGALLFFRNAEAVINGEILSEK